MTLEERNELLKRIDFLAKKMYGPSDKKLSAKELQDLDKQREDAKAQYLKELPVIPVGRCPYCDSIVKKTIDTFGLDGPWWDIMAQDLKPQSCEHFFVLLAAVNLEGISPQDLSTETTHYARPGPEVPYLVPRLLEIPQAKCILFSKKILMEKHQAYFITYFCDPPVSAEQGHQGWPRNQFYYTDGQGNTLWNSRNDPWDFDIENWMTRSPSKIGWIDADDTDMKIQFTPPDKCPYINVPGRRRPLLIKQGKVHELALPSGTPSGQDIFE